MELTEKNIRKILLVCTFAIVLFWGVQNLGQVLLFFGSIKQIVMPFFAGLCVAFVINVPMTNLERFFRKPRRCPRFLKFRRRPLFKGERPLCKGWEKGVRPISLILSLVIIVSIIVFALTMVIPQLISTIATLTETIVQFVPNAQRFFNEISLKLEDYPEYQKLFEQVVPDWNNLVQTVINFFKGFSIDALTTSVGAATSIFSAIISFFLTMVFSFYVVAQKEKLGRQARSFLYAFLPEHAAKTIIDVASLSYRTFFTFVTVQLTEAAILGSLCFIGMSIFNFPYALMISVMMFILALIPIVGAWISCIVGAFLILMVDPMKAIWFVVFILVLQQVEGNLIYPRVVSSSFGLPAMWVLVAVTVGSSAFGMFGLMISVPVTCVIYTLVREKMHAELKRKQISDDKISGNAV